MTECAAMLSTLRLEGDYKNTTLVGQAQVLGITAEEYLEWERSGEPPMPGWPERVKEHYNLTDQEYELRLFIASEDAIFKASGEQMNPLGFFIRDICSTRGIRLQDITDATFFGFGYINSMSFGLRPIEATFVEKLADLYKMPIPRVLSEYMNSDEETPINLVGRTLKQRVVLFRAPAYMLSVSDVKVERMEAFLKRIATKREVTDYTTPFLHYCKRLLPKRKKPAGYVLSFVELSRSHHAAVLAGEANLSFADCNEIADKMSLSVLERQELQFLNTISRPNLDRFELTGDMTKYQESLMELLLSKVPYMTDEQATDFLALCWLPVNEAIPPTYRPRTTERAPRFSTPKAPAVQFLFSLPGNENLTPADIQNKLGIHYSTYLRRSLGRINTSLDGYKTMCDVFELDSMEQELLRYFCGLSRTMEHIYLADCTCEQRLLADDLRNSISLVRAEDVAKIRSILAKYM